MTNLDHLKNVVTAVFGPISVILTLAVILNNKPMNAYANKGGEAVNYTIKSQKIDRVKSLENFFDKYKSPLKPYSADFVEASDTYGLDYRLLPAISCIESSCGKHLIPDSYNPFGWGIYGNHVITFDSYPQAINEVGRGLNKNYLAKGLDTPEEIAPVYTPPSHVHWLAKVHFFMSQVDSNSQLYGLL